MPIQSEGAHPEVIGLMPAGGHGTRIGPLPCSKELYPIGFQPAAGELGGRPKVVCHYLLEKMRTAGVTKAYIVLREGKWDIPAYLRDGTMLGMHFAYLLAGARSRSGVPYTLDQAYPFVGDAVVAFGFPDIIFRPDDAFVQLLDRQAKSGADVTLGLFPADQPQQVDMVDLEDTGRVRGIVIRPSQTRLRYTWCIAVWTPVFSRFLHDSLPALNVPSTVEEREWSVGHLIDAAVQSGLHVDAVQVSEEPYLDIGTPEGLMRAVREFAF